MVSDKVIAVGALVIAIAVPIATLFFSQEHDSDRLHAEQVQADRAELRTALDAAADILYNAGARFLVLYEQVSNKRAAARNKPLEASRAFHEDLAAIGERHNRLAIRLGRDAPAVEQIIAALNAGKKVSRRYLELLRDPAAADQYLSALDQFGTKTQLFVDAANRVAGSTIH